MAPAGVKTELSQSLDNADGSGAFTLAEGSRCDGRHLDILAIGFILKAFHYLEEIKFGCFPERDNLLFLKVKPPLPLGGSAEDYFDYIKRIRAIGVTARIIPGIMPIPNWQGLVKFTSNCGASIPQFVADIFRPLDGNDEASYRRGVDFTVEQCNELLQGGAPGLHFFTMNRVNPVMEIMNRIKR